MLTDHDREMGRHDCLDFAPVRRTKIHIWDDSLPSLILTLLLLFLLFTRRHYNFYSTIFVLFFIFFLFFLV